MRRLARVGVDRVSRTPRPLVLLLLVVGVFGVAWAMVVPPWQSPDSFTHYTYIESLATRLAIPGREGFPESSSSARAAQAAVGAQRMQWSTPEAKASWNPAAARAYRARSGRLSRSDGAGPTPSSIYPPLYYAYGAAGYLAAVGGDSLDRYNLVQLWGVPLLLATVLGTWLLAGEVFGRRRLLQLIAAAVAALQPMTTFMSTAVNPDALMITLWTFVLWLGARVIRRAAPHRDVLLLCALTAAAILTKETSYALIAPVLVALLLGWLRHPVERRRERLSTLASGLLIAALPVGAWLLILSRTGRPTLQISPPVAGVAKSPSSFVSGFFDYLWQFYLPRLPWQSPFRLPTLGALPWPRYLPGLPVWNVWIREGWAVFGWIDIYLPSWVYAILAAVTGAVAVTGAAILTRLRTHLHLSLISFFAVAVVALLAVIHVVEFETLSTGLGPNTQGRYVLPLVALFGLAIALIVSRLPRRLRGAAGALILCGLLALQVMSLAAVAKSYYT